MPVKVKHLSPRKQPNQERSRVTVDSIIRATAHILEREGFEKTSTNKIAEKAGVSIGSLYQYFPTKEAILSVMMENHVNKELEMINRILSEKKSHNLKETIHAIIFAAVESKRQQSRFTRIFAQKVFTLDKMDLLKRVDEKLIETFKQYLAPFEAQLRTENLDLSLQLIIQTIKLVPVALMFQNRQQLDDPRVVEELVHMAYQYIKKS